MRVMSMIMRAISRSICDDGEELKCVGVEYKQSAVQATVGRCARVKADYNS